MRETSAQVSMLSNILSSPANLIKKDKVNIVVVLKTKTKKFKNLLFEIFKN